MKRPALLFLLLLCGVAAVAQNYQPLQAGVKRYFRNSVGYLRGMRIDSVLSQGNDLIYYPFHSPRGFNYDVLGTQLNPAGGSWLGKQVIAKPDGTFLFDNIWGDTVKLQTQSHAGESWVFYDDATSLYYRATVIDEQQETVLGQTDSVKTIEIAAYDGQVQVTADPADGLQIRLSKEHGLVQAIDLHTFPYHPPGMSYQPGYDRLLDLVNLNDAELTFLLFDFTYPTKREMYDWNVGDAYQYETRYHTWSNYPNYEYDSIVSKTVLPGQTDYAIVGKKHLVHFNQYNQAYYTSQPFSLSFTLTDAPFFDTTRMPEEHNNPLLIYLDDNNLSYGLQARLFSLGNTKIFNNQYYSGLFYYPFVNRFKIGLSRVNMQFVDGEAYQTDTMLTYYRRSGNVYGTINTVSVPHYEKPAISISSDPASGVISIHSPGLGYKELVLLTATGTAVRRISGSADKEQISLSGLAASYYFLNIYQKGQLVYSGKVFVDP